MEIFCKKNHINNDSLIKESKGLELLEEILLSSNSSIKIPRVYSVDRKELKIEKIDSKISTSQHMKRLGIELAKLHKIEFPDFGLSYDNYIGLNLQKNILTDNWGEFFFTYRLDFQVQMIKNKNIKDEFEIILKKYKKRLIDFFNDTTKHASLVHGDLWSGNVLFDQDSIYLIDPAVYYGDREVDIAMTHMFGGFSNDFYENYNLNYPLSYEYETKEILYNLYHYLNHYNLFGNSYLSSCIRGFEFINKI